MVKFANFVDETTKFWNSYFQSIQKVVDFSPTSLGKRILFPSIAVFINYGEFYVVEFIGVNKNFRPLSIRYQESKSILSYSELFHGGDHGSAITFTGINHNIMDLHLGTNADFEKASKIFPILKDHHLGSILNFMGDGSSFFSFSADFASLQIQRCTLVETMGAFSRARLIVLAHIFRSSVSQGFLRWQYRAFTNIFRSNYGLPEAYLKPNNQTDGFLVASQLQSIVRLPGLHENTIGHFIVRNPDIAKAAFGCVSLFHELSLPWLEHDGSVEDSEIRPDLLIGRADGTFDICDFKLAKLDKKSLTRGPRKRRRFIDYMNEGISQLNNYKFYFSFAKNAKFAQEKYGINVIEPKLILIAGHYENVIQSEVLEACRPFKDITVIDYDTLASMFISIST